jgi:glycosyltransferase involved in cell wall biosynthesis
MSTPQDASENGACDSQISIVIPAYNEEDAIGLTMALLIGEPRLAQAEIIVVNDGSHDQTTKIVRQFARVHLFEHQVNLGYGAAISTGIRQATRPYVIWYDSDGQHRVEDLLKIADTLVNDQLEYCIGVRKAHSHQVANRWLGKAVLRLAVRFTAGQSIEDFNSGLRGFKRSVILRYLHLLPRGFSASTTTTLLMLERNHLGRNVPILVHKRIGQSSVKQIRDGLRTLLTILRIFLLFKPLYFFSVISLLLITFGSIYGLGRAFTTGRGIPVLAALLIILGLQSLFFGILSDQISLLRRERLE